MKVDGKVLSPWADVSRLFGNMRTLTVKAGGKSYTGDMDVSLDDEGGLTIDVGGRAAPAEAKAEMPLRKVAK